METKNHLALAKYLVQETSDQMLDRYKNVFVLGNIMPDINLLTYFQGRHYTDFTSVKKKIIQLLAKPFWNAADIYILGIITHYIADFFTRPHNQQYRVNLIDHYKYESTLCAVIKDCLDHKPNRNRYNMPLKSEDLITHIETKHQEYLEIKTSPVDDCYFIISISTSMLHSVFTIMNLKRHSELYPNIEMVPTLF